MSVQRYAVIWAPVGDGGHEVRVEPSGSGAWCRAEDVEALEAEVVALRAEVVRLREALEAAEARAAKFEDEARRLNEDGGVAYEQLLSVIGDLCDDSDIAQHIGDNDQHQIGVWCMAMLARVVEAERQRDEALRLLRVLMENEPDDLPADRVMEVDGQ